MPEFTTHHAKITVQTQDALTGKIVDQVHGENFSANQVIRHAKWQQRSIFKTGLTALGSSDTDYSPHQATQALVLTDSGLSEDPTNEWQMPGGLIGYAIKSTYAGSDIYRGTPNVTQLEATAAYSKWVFDWPTNAANGTIRSVGWVGIQNTSASVTDPIFVTGPSIEQTWSTAVTAYYFARASNTLSFACATASSTSVTVMDSTYAQTTTFNVTGQFTAINGLAWDSGNNFLWVIGTNSSAKRIAAYNSSGVLQTGPYTLTTRTYGCLAYDGTYLWSTTKGTGNAHTAWKISTSDGSDVSNFAFGTAMTLASSPGTAATVCGLCWDPTYSRLWVRQSPYASGQTACWFSSYNTNGEKQTPDVSPMLYTPSAAAFNLYANFNTGSPRDFDIIDGNQFALPVLTSGGVAEVYRLRVDNLGTRSLLSSPVVKANTQTLKVIYTINYV